MLTSYLDLFALPVSLSIIWLIPLKTKQSLKTEPRIKREYNVGYILCKVAKLEMASRKRQTYQNEAKNLCTICV